MLWVKASTRDSIMAGYADAAVELLGGDRSGAAERLLAWLANTSRRWLVVLDDLEAPASLDGLWAGRHDRLDEHLTTLQTKQRRDKGKIR